MTTGSKARKQTNEGLVAYIVSGEGTDEEIAARCAASIPTWNDRTSAEKAETVRLMRHFWELPAAPLYGVDENEDGTTVGKPMDADATMTTLRLVETFASRSSAFVDGKVGEVVRYFRRAKDRNPTDQEVQSALGFIRGVNPTNTAQSSLALQMHATHEAAMMAVGRFQGAETAEQAQIFGNIGTKLLNAYARQAETLAKIQRGGEQTIKHVHIDNRGGQAVVTDQVVTRGAAKESGEQPDGTRNLANGTALLSQDAQGNGVPISCDTREETMQAARRTVAGRS